jgi:hypothetical protein
MATVPIEENEVMEDDWAWKMLDRQITFGTSSRTSGTFTGCLQYGLVNAAMV